jgi:hypothetical protein
MRVPPRVRHFTPKANSAEIRPQTLECTIWRGGAKNPKFAQNGKVKAGVRQFDPQSILPVNAPVNGIGCLAVGEVLAKLHEGDEGQTPRRFTVVTDLRSEPVQGDSWCEFT